MHRRCVGILPQMGAPSDSRAPETPPVPGPNPWMALVEAVPSEEAMVACAEATTLTRTSDSGLSPVETELSASTGTTADDRDAALGRRGGAASGPLFLAQLNQQELPASQDQVQILELEGLTSLNMARALLQPASLATSSFNPVPCHWSSEPTQVMQIETEGFSSLVVTDCCRPCISLLTVCHHIALKALLRWISLEAVAASGMPGYPCDPAYACRLTNGMLLSVQACTHNTRGSGQTALGARCRLERLQCLQIAGSRVPMCGREPSCPTCRPYIAAHAPSGHPASLAEGSSSPGMRDYNGGFVTRRSNRCAWTLPCLTLFCHVRMQCIRDLACLPSCSVVPHAWMSGTSVPTLCTGTSHGPWPTLRNRHPLAINFCNQGCTCIAASADQAAARHCFDWRIAVWLRESAAGSGCPTCMRRRPLV